MYPRIGPTSFRTVGKNPMSAFTGWPVEAVEFYEGLQADNSKVYWAAHKTVYENCVRAPMEQLLAELAEEFGAGKLFRPYRDVRFSADKTPYKTTCSATLGSGTGQAYVSFSADALSVGGGLYMPDPATLQRYRIAVDRDKSGTELAEATSEALGYLDQCLENGFRPGMGNVLPDRLFWAHPPVEEDALPESSFELSPPDTRH